MLYTLTPSFSQDSVVSSWHQVSVKTVLYDVDIKLKSRQWYIMWTSNQSVLSHADIKLKSRQCCIMWTSHLQSRRCYITLTSQLLSRQCCIKLQSRQRCIVLTSNLQSRQCCIMSTPSFSQDRGSPGWPIIALCDCVFIAHGLHWNDTACTIYFIHPNAAITHVGNYWAIQAGLLTPLNFARHFGCFYFRCVLSSQWKAATVNLQILHCQL